MNYATAGLLVALGLLPSLVWMFFFYRQDCHPEPKYLVTKTFLMGIIISPLAVMLECNVTKGVVCPFLPSLNILDIGSAPLYLWSAFAEELIKLLAVYFIAIRSPEFDEPIDAIIYMMMAGLGFAAIENILYLFGSIQNGMEITLKIWALRSVGSTLLHALSSGLIGYFLALSWFFQAHRKKLIVVGLFIATLFHFTFNIFLAGTDNQLRGLLLSVGLLCVMAFLVFLLFDKMRGRSSRAIPRLTAATEKEISIT